MTPHPALAALLLLFGCGDDPQALDDAGRATSDGGRTTGTDATLRPDSGALRDSAPPPIGDAPGWFVAMPDGEWIEVAAGSERGDLSAAQRGGRIIDVAPDPLPPGAEGVSAVTNDWTGGTALQARGEYILPAQGGHNGYYGNEIYALALREETPAWARIWGPTPIDQIRTSEHPINAPYTAYEDGSPRTSHGWFHIQTSRDERIWLLFSGANPSGTWTTETYSIARGDLGAGWMFHGRLWTDIGGPSDFFYQTGPSAYDPVAHTMFSAAEASNIAPFVVRFDVETCLAAGERDESGPLVAGLTGHLGYHAAEFQNAWSAVAHDLTPRVWIAGEPTEGTLAVLDMTNPDAGFATPTLTGDPPPEFGSGMGAVYHPASRSVIVGGIDGGYGGGESGRPLWVLSIPSDPLGGEYVFRRIDPPGATEPQSDDQFRGTFSKFQIIEDMGNGQSALVFVTNVEGPTYVFKVPHAW